MLRDRIEYSDAFRPSVRAILYDIEEKRILVVRHRSGLWILPGGGPEKEEIPINNSLMPALLGKIIDREIREEVGLEIKGKSRVVVGSFEWWNDPLFKTMARLDLVVAIKLAHDEIIKARPCDEIRETGFVRVVDLFTLPQPLASNAKEAIFVFAKALFHLNFAN